MEIRYWISPHKHPLQLRNGTIEEDGNFLCQICDSHSASGTPFYVCNSCTGFYVHKSCAEPPIKIQHPSHPHSPLTLRPNSKWSALCNSCFTFFQDAPSYQCHCSFKMDAECALMPLETPGVEGQDWIRHYGHPHPLSLLRVDEDQRIKCAACKSTNQALYGCSKCGYFLDKSCADLPKNIQHPLHHERRSTLESRVTRLTTCGKCRISMGDRYNFEFSSSHGPRCFECADVEPMRSAYIKYEDHQHLLCCLENIKYPALLSPCNVGYDSYCRQAAVSSSDEFKHPKASTLWCRHCGFRVHLLCAPLPSMLKHKFHIHSLVLVDSMREDDSGEYYCDVCETKRDPQIRLYCCQKCKYFAHIHCLVPEIVKLLNGDLEDVELKTVGQDFWTVPGRELKIENMERAMTLKDMINGLSEGDKHSIQRIYKWDETSSGDQKWKHEDSPFNKVGDEEIDEILQFSRCPNGGFRSFWFNYLQIYYLYNKLELKPSDLALKIVKLKGYMIPRSLAAVLNTLLHEFGNIGIGSRESLGFKSFLLFILCKVVKRMHNTMAKCITKDLLQEWYFHLRFARAHGFKLDFACAQLEELVGVFLGFQAKRLEHEIPKILNEKIVELQRKLDECYEFRGSSPKSKDMEYFLNKASEYEWNDAFGDSLAKKRNQVSPWF